MNETTETPAPEKTKKTAGRRFLSVLLFGTVGLTTVLFGLIGAVVFLVTTDAGLEVVRAYGVPVGASFLTGDLEVGTIRGSLLSRLTIKDVVLTDDEDRRAIEVDELSLAWRPSALLSGEIVVEDVVLRGPRVLMVQNEKGLNLARLVPPSPPKPKKPSKPLNLPPIHLGKLTLEGGEVSFTQGTERLADAKGLEIELFGEASGSTIEAELPRLTASVAPPKGTPSPEKRLSLRLSVKALLEDMVLTVSALELDLDRARVRVPHLKTELPPGPLAGNVRLFVPADLVHAVGGPDAVLADVDLLVRAKREEDAPVWSADLEGALGPSPLGLTATVSETVDRLDVALSAKALDPGSLYRGLPEGRLDMELVANGDLARKDVEAKLELRGWLRPDPAQKKVYAAPLEIDARWRGDAAEARAVGRVAQAALDLDAAVVNLEGGTPRLTKADVRVSVPKLEALVSPALAGRVDVRASATGPIDDLSVKGELGIAKLTAGEGVRVRSAGASWDLQGIPAEPDGNLHVEAEAVALPGRSIEAFALDAKAKSRGGAVDVELPRLRLVTGPVVWRGRGARFSRQKSGAMELERFSLRSSAGALRVDAKTGPPAPPKGDLSATVRVEGLDVAKIPRSVAPELGTLSGLVDLDLAASKARGRTRADVDVRVDTFRLEDARPPVSAAVKAVLRPGRANAEITALGLAEKLFVTAEAKAPKDATNPAAWTGVLRGGPVERVTLDLDALDLEKVFSVIGQPPPLRGLASLDLSLTERGRRLGLQLEADGIRFDALEKAEAFARADVRFTPGKLQAAGRLEGQPLGAGTFSATVAGPKSVFDAEGWRKLGPLSVSGAEINFDDLKLSALAELGLVEDFAGRLDVKAKAGPEALPLTVSVKAAEVRTPFVEGTWATDVDARLDEKGAKTEVALVLDGASVVEARAEAPLTLAGIIEGTTDPTTVPLDVAVRIGNLPLRKVAKLAKLNPKIIQGRVEGTLDAKGPPTDLDGKLRFAIRDIILSQRKFEDFTLNADVEGQAFTARSTFGARGSGGLVLTATGSAEGASPAVDARLVADGLPLDLLSRLGVSPVGLGGALHADTAVKVLGGEVEPNGWLEIRDLRIVFPQAALQPLHSGQIRIDLAPKVLALALEAKSVGKGSKLLADGSVDLSPSSGPIIKADAKLRKFPVNAGQMARMDVDIDVDGRVTEEEGTSIDVLLSKGFVELPDETTRSMHPISHPEEVEFVARLETGAPKATETATKAPGAPVVVTVKAKDRIRVRGAPVDAAIDLELTSRTNVRTKKGLRGRIWVPEGTVTLVERDYRIEQAEIILEGRDPPNPRLNIRLVHEFTDDGVDFFIRVTGNADAPNVEFAASPARFSRPELLQIFTGTKPSELGQTSDRTVEDQAAGAAVGFLAGQLQKELKGAVPLDTLEVDVTEEGISNFTLGKWITREVFVAYRRNFEATQLQNENEVVAQYRFLPGWMVELVVGIQRQDLDLLWLKRF